MSDTRQRTHELIDRLPFTQLVAVAGLLGAMLEPLSCKLAMAPVEDEEITEEEERAVVEAKEWLKQNNAIPHEEVPAGFGLTLDDFRKLGETPLPPESSSGNG